MKKWVFYLEKQWGWTSVSVTLEKTWTGRHVRKNPSTSVLCSYSLRCLSVSKCGDSSCGQTVRLTATVIYYPLRDQSDGSYINCWLVDQLVGILCLVFSPCSLDLGTQKHALISNIVLFPSELLVNIFKFGFLLRFDHICYVWRFDFKWDLFIFIPDFFLL